MRGMFCLYHHFKTLTHNETSTKTLAREIVGADAYRGIKADGDAFCERLSDIPHGVFPLESASKEGVWELQVKTAERPAQNDIEGALAD